MSTVCFRLDAAGHSMVWVSHAQRLPSLLYWGEALARDADLQALAQALQQPLPHGGLDVAEEISWLPEPGRGFTDEPGLALRRAERHLYTQFQLDAAQRVGTGWCFDLSDAAAGLGLALHIGIDPLSGVCSAFVELRNLGLDALAVHSLASLTIPVPCHLNQRLSLGGRWAGEFAMHQQPVTDAAWHQASRVGRSSHHAYPGLVLMAAGTNATQGEAISLQLACSGNHQFLLQRCRLGPVQLQLGELLLPGEVLLAPGDSHRSASVHLLRGDKGLRELGSRWHSFVRQHILPSASRNTPRRVQFNSWEATYFNHETSRLRALAQAAADVGVERFVLDDGWFAGRHHDRAGLGDWQACPQRYPQGLAPLAQHCNALGMRFGLWLEPEGVNANSDLFRAHPQWLLGDTTRPLHTQPLGRHQYVLNFGLAAVRDELFAQLSRLLNSAPIDFIKWDMNRDMTHANHCMIDEVREDAGEDLRQEVRAFGRAAARAHVQGVHAVMDRLRRSFPALEIETCASGGGRADLAMLQRCDRLWVSDNNDPLERQRMHAGLLHFLPPEVMGVHVGDAQSHTSGRVSGITLRTLNALFGHFGVEANLLDMPQADREHLRAAIGFYKTERAWLHGGQTSAIDTGDPALVALLAHSADATRALLSVVALSSPSSAQLPPLRVPGLAPGDLFDVALHPLWLPNPQGSKTAAPLQGGGALQLSGRMLAAAGLVLPLLRPGTGVLFVLRRLGAQSSTSAGRRR
jgi:alpha-galactosidase